jgi:hypothetical protein
MIQSAADTQIPSSAYREFVESLEKMALEQD